MKKWFYICTSAVVAGFIAFVITFVKYDIDNNDNKEILPVKVDTGKYFVKAQSSIMINPESVNHSYEDEYNVVIDDKDDSVQEVSVEPMGYFNPVDGNVIREFAKDNLIYSKTLKEWTTHDGIDIEANVNDIVKCIYPGIVSKVEFDYMYGNFIEVDHCNGYKSIYAGIEPITNIKVGDKVKQGDEIARIIEGCGLEMEEKPHLHFKVLKNNININPLDILKY